MGRVSASVTGPERELTGRASDLDSSTENRDDGGGRSGRSHVGDVADGSLETGGGVGAFPSFSTLVAWTTISELGEGSRGTQALGGNSAGLSNRDFCRRAFSIKVETEAKRSLPVPLVWAYSRLLEVQMEALMEVPELVQALVMVMEVLDDVHKVVEAVKHDAQNY